MQSAALFVLSILAVAVFAILVVFKTPNRAKDFFKTKDGRGVVAGILIFVVLPLLVVALTLIWPSKAKAEDGEWFAYAEIFVGLDYVKGNSPQCEPRGPNSNATSNGGARLNVYLTADEKFSFNSKYTHHSCAFSPDSETYDGFGVEAVYRFDL